MTLSPLVRVAALDDPCRLAALARTGLMDTEPEPAFDRLTRLAGRLLSAPAAFLTFVDDRRVFVKSAQGLGETWRGRSLPSLAHAFSPAVIRTGAALMVGDARATPNLTDHPAVRELGVAAYAGVPISAPGGHLVGGLAVADSAPRRWHDDDVVWLEELAALARSELELRLARVRDPAAGLVTPGQLETALAGRLAAAKLEGAPCALIRLALRPRARGTTLPGDDRTTRHLRAAFGEQGLVARTGEGAYALLPGRSMTEREARRLATSLARRLAHATTPDEPACRVLVGVASNEGAAQLSPTALLAAAQAVMRALPATRRGATR